MRAKVRTLSRASTKIDRVSEGTFNPWPEFGYSGTLRAVYPLSPRRAVPDHIGKPDYAKDGQCVHLCIQIPLQSHIRRLNLSLHVAFYLGIPRSEIKEPYNSIRILNKEEQEKMRVVCKVNSSSIPFVPDILTTLYPDGTRDA